MASDNPNPRFSRQADISAMEQAASLMRNEGGPFMEALAALMDKTVWMGRLDPDMLSRVPCDQIIDAAKAYLLKA